MALSTVLTVLVFSGRTLAVDPIDTEPINYSSGSVNDAVSQLQQRIDAGQAKLTYDKRLGYLPAVLKQLGISATSQTLVFSKTSFQQRHISPQRPRALYFNDEAYVGWVRGATKLEISAVDPQKGAVFYTISQRDPQQARFVRHTHECLQCHTSSLTQGVPGHLVRSVYPDAKGYPILGAGTFRTDHTSPLDERWGGWYVTGQHGGQRHMGNVLLEDEEHPESLPKDAGANVVDLEEFCDTSSYLSPHSDIVALMVLEHQTQMHNRITAANYATRRAQFHSRIMNSMLERPADELSESALRRIRSASERLVRYMLFVDEATLTDPISGTSGFAEEFVAPGPFDAQGRSLRTLDLQGRLFRYPCSYLIYSAAFDALPPVAKEQVYRRLHEILTGSEQSEDFGHLSPEDRRALLEILTSTKPELVVVWKQLGLTTAQ
ncbi:MAG: hypothetical protein OES79_04930 [Planctomycetota bacterium]|nr:hypothetical protein [Planctomycetota bacterium]